MSDLAPSTSFLQCTERIGQGTMSGGFQSQRYASFSFSAYCESTWPLGNSPHTTSIHILNDDSLLNVFYLYRPFLLDEDEDGEDRFNGGKRQWSEECWWYYKLVHVCQRWRNIIFRSASYLGLSLVCTKGTPVTDMLAHSPSFPLVIDYVEKYRCLAAEDEERAILALKQRNRIRRIRLFMPITNLQKFIDAIEEEYPILEYLIVWSLITDITTFLMFPETFHAPHLRHLALVDFCLPTASRLLTSAVGLVTLCLVINHPTVYFDTDTLLQWLSFMPQLESLMIGLIFIFPDRGVERQTPVTLPNLHHFSFQGHSTYLEALIYRITPRPEKLELHFTDQRTFSVPRLLQFMNTTENRKFESAKVKFYEWRASVAVYPCGETEMYALSITISKLSSNGRFDWLVSSVARLSQSFSQIFSAVERLDLERDDEADSRTPEEHWCRVVQNGVDPIKWRQLLSSFNNVKTLRINNGLVEEVSRCLELDDGELPLELLPELQELAYSRSGEAVDGFTSFMDARQNAGRPITLTRY
jgi:hypothetical protein